MQPQGQAPVNDTFFEKQREQVENCSVCAQLQAQVNAIFASLQAANTAVTTQIERLTPILALLSAPSNPTEVITWITNFITSFLQPYVQPLTTYISQQAEIALQITDLTAAIKEAKSKIPNCSITIPPIV